MREKNQAAATCIYKSHIIIYKVKDPQSYRLYKNHQAHKFLLVLLEIAKYLFLLQKKSQHNLLKGAMWTESFFFFEMYSQFCLRVLGVKALKMSCSTLQLFKKADKQCDLFVVQAWAQSSTSSRKPICVSCEATLAISMVWRIWRMTGSSDFNHKASGKVLNVRPCRNTKRLRL